jgi:hypothetical protein
MPFDAAMEFEGINLETEVPEIFRISLPDGKMALVAPGETTPKHAAVNGIEVEGTSIRYFQVSKDSNEICGLGLTHISGLVTFFEPATFRLKRTSNNTSHVTTNTGFSLTEEWLGGEARCIEALTFDHQWLDVTDQCQPDSVPVQVVREWSDRNQRTLVDFRISI